MINPKMTPVANIGDLVNINGYANRLFRVDSYTHEFTFERGIESEDIYYDCTCVSAGEYNLGAQEDITVVCRADDTAEFLKTYEHPEVDVIALDIFENMFVNMTWGAEDVIQPIKATVAKTKEPTKQELIDGYLDELINVNNAIELIGDEDGYYGAKKAGILAGMKALVERR